MTRPCYDCLPLITYTLGIPFLRGSSYALCTERLAIRGSFIVKSVYTKLNLRAFWHGLTFVHLQTGVHIITKSVMLCTPSFGVAPIRNCVPRSVRTY